VHILAGRGYHATMPRKKANFGGSLLARNGA
jgi:hypothetical protein